MTHTKSIKVLLADQPMESMGYAQPLPPSEDFEDLMDSLWLRLAEMYGGLFTGFGLTPNKTWKQALEGSTEEDIARGLKSLVDNEVMKPPSIMAFRKMCRVSSECASFKVFTPDPLYIQSDSIKATKQAEMAKIREMGI